MTDTAGNQLTSLLSVFRRDLRLAEEIDLGRRLGPAATIVTVMCDSGIKYLSTALYGDGGEAAWSGKD